MFAIRERWQKLLLLCSFVFIIVLRRAAKSFAHIMRVNNVAVTCIWDSSACASLWIIPSCFPGGAGCVPYAAANQRRFN